MFLREFPTMIDGPTIMRESLQIGLKRKHVEKHVNAWRGANPTQGGGKSVSFGRKDSQSSWTNDSPEHNESPKKGKGKKFSIPNAFRKKAEKEIVIEDLGPKLLPIVGSIKFAVLIHNVLTPDECKQMIERAESGGFEDASIYDRRANRIHRNCQRWYEHDNDLAASWYDRILEALDDTPSEYKIRNAPWMGRRYNSTSLPIRSVGLNERLRVLKYSQGEYFGSHMDTKFVRGPNYGDKAGETSHVSVHVYLNDKFKGGQTRFHGKGRHYDVKPKTGSILIFDHNLLHQGAVIKSGKKYIVRTDVMYRKMRTRGDEISTLSGLPDVVGLDLRQAL
jgi:predicted 2-oxoglutarate/Fe(II)-dependent dioxygenase YbiX